MNTVPIGRLNTIPKPRRSNRPRGRGAVKSGIGAQSIAADLFVFAAGLSCTFTIHLVGDLPVAEILTVMALPFLLVTKGSRIMRPRLALIFGLLSLWLLNQVLTDIWRRTAATDWMRGDANLIFFGIDLLVLVMLISKNERRQVYFLAGYCIGSLLSARLQPSDAAIEEPWKFGYATGTNALIALVACYFFARRQYAATGVLLGSVIALNLAENFRSPVLNILVAIALILPVIPERIGRLTILPRRGSLANVAVIIGLAAVSASAALWLVRFATERGMLNEEAVVKNQIQAQSAGGLLLGGRPEILVSSQAVLDSPILGHGSWARDYKYIEMLADIQTRWGIPIDLDYTEELLQGLIPTHSHLMGAWVQAGILGAVFWFYILWLVAKGLIQLSVLRPALSPILSFMLTSFLFDIFFSPFASMRRLTEAFLLVILLDMLQTSIAVNPMRTRVWRRQPPPARTSSIAAQA